MPTSPSPVRTPRRGWASIIANTSSRAEPSAVLDEATRQILPPRYHDGTPISSAPMGGAAELIYNDDGTVAWDRIWTDFCDLALAGGPPHRETMLEAPSTETIAADPDGYARAMHETTRALTMLTGWSCLPANTPGWADLSCPDSAAARWLERAILAENVRAVQVGLCLRLPVGPDFTIEQHIRNVATATAKAHHYWAEHRAWLDAILAEASPPS